jgi:RNA polymerase sigma-70 factor (ECF subfamily)
MPKAPAAELTDAEYVISSRNGCPDHFRFLVERYQRPLFTFLAGRLRDFGEAEEAAQESFVRAFMSLPKLNKPDSFFPWLLGIAGRVAKEQFRSQKRGEQDRLAAENLLQEPIDPPDYPLEEALATLPESYRQVLLLRYYEGLSCQEVAARLCLPLGTVTKTLSRAYALLRQQLKGEANTAPDTTHTFGLRVKPGTDASSPITFNRTQCHELR